MTVTTPSRCRSLSVRHSHWFLRPQTSSSSRQLKGVTFNAVGSGTVVENVEVYSTYDDGVEFFGGAVNLRNFVALYVRDDSIDFSDGWSGSIDNALVIHSRSDANHCIEGDNVGSGRTGTGVPYDTAPISAPTIRNLTCITSQSPTATHGQSRGAINQRHPARPEPRRPAALAGTGADHQSRASHQSEQGPRLPGRQRRSRLHLRGCAGQQRRGPVRAHDAAPQCFCNKPSV